MNIHQVATPEMMLEDARTYVLFFRENKRRCTAYITLHLLTTDRKLYYSYSANPFHEDKIGAVEEEAFAFAEGLGAMLDEIDFTKISDAEQDRWLDAQDMFSIKQPADSKLAPQPSLQIPPEAAAAVQTTSTPTPPMRQQSVAPASPKSHVPAHELPPRPTAQTVPSPEAAPAAPPQQQPIWPTEETATAQSAAPTAPPQQQPIWPTEATTTTQSVAPAAPPQQQPAWQPEATVSVPPVQHITQPARPEPITRTSAPDSPEERRETEPQHPAPTQQPSKPVQKGSSSKRSQKDYQPQIKTSTTNTQMPAKDTQTHSASLISRDREALARLLTSF